MTFIVISCNKKKGKTYLSKDDFTQILFDIHLTDGTLTTKKITRKGKEYRPNFYYNSIYEKYNITADQLDSTIVFYSQNTALYEKIYTKIIDSLNRMETRVRIALRDSIIANDTVNLWKGKNRIFLHRQSKEDLSFSIPITEAGTYTVRAKIRRFKDDKSEKPFLDAYFWKEDSLNEGERIYFDSIPIDYSSDFINYETQLEYPDSTFKELRGNIITWTNVDSTFTQRMDIKDIMIFNPLIKRDSLSLDSLLKAKQVIKISDNTHDKIKNVNP